MLTLNLPAERDTRRLARVLAGCLPHTATVALYGPLGAGKTYLVRCLAQALHVQDNVSSPSYVLLHEYEGPVPMFHLDLYRLSSEEEVWELGLRDMIGRGLLVVEWPELAEALLPPDALRVRLSREGAGRAAVLGGPPALLDRVAEAWRA